MKLIWLQVTHNTFPAGESEGNIIFTTGWYINLSTVLQEKPCDLKMSFPETKIKPHQTFKSTDVSSIWLFQLAYGEVSSAYVSNLNSQTEVLLDTPIFNRNRSKQGGKTVDALPVVQTSAN